MEISFDDFYYFKKLKDELEALIETIEILNDEKLMKGIKSSRKDVEAGRIHELKNIEDFLSKPFPITLWFGMETEIQSYFYKINTINFRRLNREVELIALHKKTADERG